MSSHMHSCMSSSGYYRIKSPNVSYPIEVGYLDSVPLGPDRPGMSSAWSSYPYFKSGTIVLTSMKEGLFVLRLRPVDT